MGAIESKKKIRKLIKETGKEIIGTKQLESLWIAYGGGEESIDKEQMKPLLNEIANIMQVEMTPNRMEEWIEECRSSQANYGNDKINFLHFKRLYLSIVHDYNLENTLPLTMSLQVLLPSCKTNVFGVTPSAATFRSDPFGIVPKFLKDICNILNQPEYCKQEGLYRIPGFERKIQQQIQQLDMGDDKIKLTDAPDLCGVITKFFKYLPISFLGPTVDEIYKLKDIVDDEIKRKSFSKIVSSLPSANREILALLATHFTIIERNKEFNKMSRKNLNTVFAYLGPNVLNLLLDYGNDPEIFLSTVKYCVTIPEAAFRSNGVPSPISQLIPFLNGFVGVSPDLYNHSRGITYEPRVREIIYQLNNNEKINFNGKQDVIPTSIALLRFLRNIKDPLWDKYESELVKFVNDKEKFLQVFQQLSPAHLSCCLAIANHIKALSQHHHTIEDWCNRFPIYHSSKIIPAIIAYYPNL